MAYSHKAAPWHLRAKHMVQPSFAKPWARTAWRDYSGEDAFDVKDAIVWGIQHGAFSPGDYSAGERIKALFERAGLLLGGASDQPGALVACLA